MLALSIAPLLLLATTASSATVPGSSSRCSGLSSLSLENTTILEALYTPAGSNVSIYEQCSSSVNNSVDVCRVYATVNTTSESSTKFVLWLPDTWYGRYLFTGDGALGGCINYVDLDYSTSFHFATIASDNGHDGEMSGASFLNQPEVITDFVYRGAHVSAVIGKQIVEAYYGGTPSKSYYLGCSAGGRQGVEFGLRHPDFFDGIIAGAPAVDWNHLWGWSGMLSTYVGQPLLNASDKYIPLGLWSMISQEILNQCDSLDGLEDGLIADPDKCNFHPEALLCDEKSDPTSCLTQAQVNALHQIYKPLYGKDGQLLYPRFDPGVEADYQYGYPMTGQFPLLTSEWYKNTVYNDSQHSFDNFSLSDIYLADSINPGGIATWDGDLSAFRNKGGKFLTFHGTRDPAIAHGNSKRFYNLISKTLSQRNLDSFYRLFWIPGMSHCFGGPGQWKFGQGGSVGSASAFINDTAHNILLAMVDWVENDVAPEFIIGGDANSTERLHCRHPYTSHWNGASWICVS